MLESQWVERADAHASRVAPLIERRLARQPRGQKNAIEDFLFDYYPYSPAKLARWHPGYGVVLEGSRAEPYLSLSGYHRVANGVTADLKWLEPRRARLDLAIRILDASRDRQPVTGCFALHEWAMTYGLSQDEVRHAYLPLRVSPAQVRQTVDEIGLRCTHIDAFRFFTPEAVPLNSLTPTRETQPLLEQAGCLHASMDLYKYAFWFSPLVPSELVVDCFENAVSARTLDMRASPYDMSPFGLEPIRVETPEGRQEYRHRQQDVMAATEPLRERLSTVLTSLRAECDAAPTVPAPRPSPATRL